MANHLTPTELAREAGLDRRDVIVKCVELGVPIFNGRIDKTLFLSSLRETSISPAVSARAAASASTRRLTGAGQTTISRAGRARSGGPVAQRHGPVALMGLRAPGRAWDRTLTRRASGSPRNVVPESGEVRGRQARTQEPWRSSAARGSEDAAWRSSGAAISGATFRGDPLVLDADVCGQNPWPDRWPPGSGGTATAGALGTCGSPP